MCIETFNAGEHKSVYFSTYVPMKRTLVLDCIRARLVTNIVLKRFDHVHFPETRVWAEIQYNYSETSSCTVSHLGCVSRRLTRFWPFSTNVGQILGKSPEWWAFFRPSPTVFKRKRGPFVPQITKQWLANDEYLLRVSLFSEDDVYRRVEGT